MSPWAFQSRKFSLSWHWGLDVDDICRVSNPNYFSVYFNDIEAEVSLPVCSGGRSYFWLIVSTFLDQLSHQQH